MIIKSASFLQSNTDISRLPKPDKPEYAFIGRSNVGKSSLINKLVQRKELAKTSSMPGKTITINHFIVNDEWYLVDLPGYGFAKRSKTDRELWKKMLSDYMTKRTNLINTFVLVDSRIEPQKLDLDFMSFMGENGLPFSIVFTKADKLGKNKLAENIRLYKEELFKDWEELPPVFVTSAETGLGRDEILDAVENWNNVMAND